MTQEQERALIDRWKAGDREAGERLVRAFLPFVASIAYEYRRWSAPMEDIVQQGCLGLLRAAARFDPGQNVRLVTYAAYWIRAEIRDFVLRSYRIVRLGTTKNERRALRCYRTTLESEPRKLAEASGLSLERAEALLPLLSSVDVSYDGTAGEGSVPCRDRLAANEETPEESAIRELDGTRAHAIILGVLAELSSREQIIARERWLSETPATLESLGSRLGVTKERVRQIEDRTRQKVRARLVELAVA
jgi:RNA polymerase sigma-32 factor